MEQLNFEGVPLEINIYDTEGDENKTREILSKSSFLKNNVIIGEYRKQNEQIIAEFGKRIKFL